MMTYYKSKRQEHRGKDLRMTLTITSTDTKELVDGGMNGTSSKTHRIQQRELNTVWGKKNMNSKVQLDRRCSTQIDWNKLQVFLANVWVSSDTVRFLHIECTKD